MWPFKKKPKDVINSVFHKGDFVRFQHNGEQTYGYIWEIKQKEDGSVIYDIQVGAQCPWIAPNVPEAIVKPYKIYQYTSFYDKVTEESKIAKEP